MSQGDTVHTCYLNTDVFWGKKVEKTRAVFSVFDIFVLDWPHSMRCHTLLGVLRHVGGFPPEEGLHVLSWRVLVLLGRSPWQGEAFLSHGMVWGISSCWFQLGPWPGRVTWLKWGDWSQPSVLVTAKLDPVVEKVTYLKQFLNLWLSPFSVLYEYELHSSDRQTALF